MKIKSFLSIIVMLIIMMSHSLVSTVTAQSPNKMSYQSVIRNTAGGLVFNQSVGIKISILQGIASGTVVYAETFTLSTNANGLVSLEIGTGAIIVGTIAAIDWTNGPYFLKTEIDPTGGVSYTITSVTQFLSVPYSLYAAAAGTTSGTAGGDLYGAYPNPTVVGIQSKPVSITSPAVDQVLIWDGVNWTPGANVTGAASGDLSGTYPNPTVVKLQSLPVSATAPATNDALVWNGAAWAPVANVSGAAGGDLLGSYPNPIVAGIQSKPVSATPPLLNDALVWNGAQWAPSGNVSGAAGGDLGGTYPNPSVVKLQTRPVSAGVPATNDALVWNGSSWTPTASSGLGTNYWTLNGSNQIYNNNAGGLVGIGTTVPSEKLEVNGKVKIDTLLTLVSAPTNLLTQNNGVISQTTDFLTFSRLNYFNVISYGALGDGSHDDTPNIQAAINAAFAAGGGTVYFPYTGSDYMVKGVLQTNISGQNPNSQLYIPLAGTGQNRIKFLGAQVPDVLGWTRGFVSHSNLKNGIVIHSTIKGSGLRPSILATSIDPLGDSQYNSTHVEIENLAFVCRSYGTTDTVNNMCGLNFCYLETFGINNVHVNIESANNPMVSQVGSGSVGVVFPRIYNDNQTEVGFLSVCGYDTAMIISEHLVAKSILIYSCNVGISCGLGNLVNTILNFDVEKTKKAIYINQVSNLHICSYTTEHLNLTYLPVQFSSLAWRSFICDVDRNTNHNGLLSIDNVVTVICFLGLTWDWTTCNNPTIYSRYVGKVIVDKTLTIDTIPNLVTPPAYILSESNGVVSKTNSIIDFAVTDKLGVGTSTPTVPLDLYRAPSNTAGNGSLGFMYDGTSGGGDLFRFRIDASLNLIVDANNGGWHPIITFNRAGGLAIGTSTPTSPLQVGGIPEYADNAAAILGGLTLGAFYKTGDLLKIVH